MLKTTDIKINIKLGSLKILDFKNEQIIIFEDTDRFTHEISHDKSTGIFKRKTTYNEEGKEIK